jgi:hypothetical protein
MVVLGLCTFTLKHLDANSRLVVLGGRKGLALLGGNDGVAGNELGHNTSNGLNAQSEGSNIKKQNVLGLLATFTRQNATLNSSTVGNSLIGVDALVQLLAE